MSGASVEAAYRLLIGVSVVAAAGLLCFAIWRLRHNISLAIGLPILILIVFSNASDLLTRAIGTPSLLQPVIAILAIGVFFARKRLQPSQPVITLLTLLLALYCLFVFASTTWAKDLGLADERVSEIVKSFAIYLLVAMIAASWSSLRQGIAAVVVTVSALAILSLVQVATGRFDNDFAGFAAVESGNIYSDVSGARIAGPMHDPNFYAQLLLVALPFAAAAAIAMRGARRTLFIIATLIIGAAVILTYSRGAMLALAVMAVLLLTALRVRMLHFATAAVAAIVLLFALPSDVTARLVTVEQLLPGSGTGVERDASVDKRKLVLGTAWNMFADHPFLGVGIANFSTRFNRYAALAGSSSPQYDDPGEGQFPHSLYMQIAAETGVVGLTLFGAAMLAAIASIYRTHRDLEARGRSDLAAIAAGIGVALCGYLLTSMFLHGAYQRPLWITLGFTAAIARLRTQPEAEVLA